MNPHEQAARERKAMKLATYLHGAGVTPRQVEHIIEMGDDAFVLGGPFESEKQFWAEAARQAECAPPGSEESQKMVLAYLKRICGGEHQEYI